MYLTTIAMEENKKHKISVLPYWKQKKHRISVLSYSFYVTLKTPYSLFTSMKKYYNEGQQTIIESSMIFFLPSCYVNIFFHSYITITCRYVSLLSPNWSYSSWLVRASTFFFNQKSWNHWYQDANFFGSYLV